MNTTNIFETASRKKFRYPYKGMITTEDLWDLNLEQLDIVFKALNKEAEGKKLPSLMANMDVLDAELFTKIEIVKFIFKVKEQEIENRKQAAANAAKRQMLLGALARRREKDIDAMSEEELLKALDEIE